MDLDLERAQSTLGDMLVVQSNQLVESSHTLGLNEKRLIVMAAAMLDSRKPLPQKGTVRISAADFAQVFGLDPRGGQAYQALAESAKKLYNRSIKQIEAGPKGARERHVRWVWMSEYLPAEGVVVLGFSPAVAPYLTMLNEQYTKYALRQVGALSSFYAIRIYELCSQFRKTGERRLSLERFREIMDLGDKYQDVKNLRMRVIEPAVEEINSSTDLNIAIEPIRKGRKVVGFVFDIDVAEQGELALH